VRSLQRWQIALARMMSQKSSEKNKPVKPPRLEQRAAMTSSAAGRMIVSLNVFISFSCYSNLAGKTKKPPGF
jgi:hypothetical protein